MKVAGVDFSTKALDIVLLDEDSDRADHLRFPLQAGTVFSRAHDLRLVLPTAALWEQWRVSLIAIEEPRGHQNAVTQLALNSLYGAIVARLPRTVPACALTPAEWKRPFTGNGNATKGYVAFRCRELGFDAASEHAADAYGIAWAARELNQRAVRSAA